MLYKQAVFRVKKEKLGEVIKAIAEFVTAIHENEPGVFEYKSFQLSDTVSFIHLMCFKDESAEKSHQTAPHTRKFVAVLYPDCDQEPTFTELTLVRGS